MADAGEEAEKPWRRAELFETLAHPTRVRILRILEKQPLSFADLKRVLGIESSGNLQHHLGKLGDLIKKTDDGKYAVTDDAREALRLLDIMRLEHETIRTDVKLRGPVKTKLSWLTPILASIVLLIVVFYEYSLLTRSIPLFSAFDLSKNFLEINGRKYYYMILAASDLRNGTSIAFHDAVFTYIKYSSYLAHVNVTLKSNITRLKEKLIVGTIVLRHGDNFVGTALVYPGSFRVEFKDGEINIVPILPHSSYSFFTRLAYVAEESRIGNIIIAFHNYSQAKPAGNMSGLLRLTLIRLMVPSSEPRALVFQIGPQAYLLLVRCENDA